MAESAWLPDGDNQRWQGKYSHARAKVDIVVHSKPGVGDITTTLKMNRPFVAESKKGPLSRSKSSAEYPLIREALGQLITIEVVPRNPFLALAVPASDKFIELAERWRKAPLIRQLGIRILTVSMTGDILGWDQ